MVIQAIGLLDDLDKELNTYAMRVREWYGWHYPEMAKIITDNIKYAKVVSKGSVEHPSVHANIAEGHPTSAVSFLFLHAVSTFSGVSGITHASWFFEYVQVHDGIEETQSVSMYAPIKWHHMAGQQSQVCCLHAGQVHGHAGECSRQRLSSIGLEEEEEEAFEGGCHHLHGH